MKNFVRRLQPRWLAELAGFAALTVGAFTLNEIAGWVTLGVALIVEGSLGEPLAPPDADGE